MKKLAAVLMLVVACGPMAGDPCPRVEPDPCTEKTRGQTGFACVCAKNLCRPGDEGVWKEVTCR